MTTEPANCGITVREDELGSYHCCQPAAARIGIMPVCIAHLGEADGQFNALATPPRTRGGGGKQWPMIGKPTETARQPSPQRTT